MQISPLGLEILSLPSFVDRLSYSILLCYGDVIGFLHRTKFDLINSFAIGRAGKYNMKILNLVMNKVMGSGKLEVWPDKDI